jgi:hypothetical protein
MASRFYTAAFKAVAVTAQQDFFQITPAANQTVIVHRWMLTQSTEVGDAQEEMLMLTTNRGVGATTTGSGGSTLTAQPVSDGDGVYGGVVLANNTTKMVAGSGSLEELEAFAWNERIPFDMVYTPEFRPQILGSARWTLELETTPADSVTISGCVWFEVLGGL